MTSALILQARMDSSRLPGKAMLDFSGKPVIFRVMENLKTVPADAHILACDEASFPVFAPVAKEAGFLCVCGPKEDVLRRFCLALESLPFPADAVLRATGDNPFLFADAAEASLRRFVEIRRAGVPADYFTYTGLPHGSGVEVFSARALQNASLKQLSAYECEHVGPALYLHPEEYLCVFEKAPDAWTAPDLRTTIDTAADYAAARSAAAFLLARNLHFPFSSGSVIRAFSFLSRAVVFVPAAGEGQGTGHLRRCLYAVLALRGRWNCFILLDGKQEKCAREKVRRILSSEMNKDDADFLSERILSAADFAEEEIRVHRFVTDCFRSGKQEMLSLLRTAPVIAVDDGGSGRRFADYVLDVIPSLLHTKKRFFRRRAQDRENAFLPGCLFLSPETFAARKGEAETLSGVPPADIRVLVAAGGADEQNAAVRLGQCFAGAGFPVTVLSPHAADFSAAECGYPNLSCTESIPALSARLCGYSLVVTHFGFTAFEALAAGCRVLLFSPSRYHKRLARACGFPLLPDGPVLHNPDALRRFVDGLLCRPAADGFPAGFLSGSRAEQQDYAGTLDSLLHGNAFPCACCGSMFPPDSGKRNSRKTKTAVWRDPEKTIQVCPVCGMPFLRYRISPPQRYGRSYFFEEYRRQYGKTYLEDFAPIRAAGEKRMRRISALAARRFPPFSEKTVLDAGCAYGPFLAAAADAGWKPFGVDLCEDAAAYVRDTLGFPAVAASFPDEGVAFRSAGFPARFTAVTFWYVIEHFPSLPAVFAKVSALLEPGGILALATPSCAGISARKNKPEFFRASPADHFSVWNPRRVKKYLARFGFRVRKIVITGHHPERFPHAFLPAWLLPPYFALCGAVSRIFGLGDTFEVYAEKQADNNPPKDGSP